MREFFHAIAKGDADAVRSMLAENASLANSRCELPPGKLDLLLLGPASESEQEETQEWFALQFAIWQGQIDVVRVLLEHGARLEGTRKDGEHWKAARSATFQSVEMMELLIRFGADVTELLPKLSWSRHALPMARLLVEHGADINALDPVNGGNTLRSVVFDMRTRENIELIDFLIQSGIDVEGGATSDGSPLCLAASLGATPTVHCLIRAGANVNAVRRLETALHMAAQQGYADIVEALLKAGADPHARNAEGQLALDLVVPYEDSFAFLQSCCTAGEP